MNPKGLLTEDQAPWVDYLVVGKKGERKLKLSTPIKIRKEYKKHLNQEKQNFKNNTPMFK